MNCPTKFRSANNVETQYFASLVILRLLLFCVSCFLLHLKSFYQYLSFYNNTKLHIMKRLSLLFLFNILCLGLFSQTSGVPECPNPMRLVVDQVGLLSEEYKNALEQKLVKFSDSTSNQILVLVVADLNGMEPADYALEVGRKWGVGNKKFNNGIVFLIKPTGGKGERKTYIAVGYGLEGVIPDITAKMIVDREVIPAFKQKQFDAGIDKAVTVLMSLAKKEYNFKTYEKKAQEGSYIALFIVLGIIALFIFAGSRKTKNATTLGSTGSSLPFFAAMMMMGSMGGRSRGGNWDNFSSGSDSFGGFGGGSFGGGGAGGSW